MKAILLAALVISFIPVSAESPPTRSTTKQTPTAEDPLDRIIFPKIDFRDATLGEAVQFFTNKRASDTSDGKRFDFVIQDEKLRDTRITFAVRNTPLSAVIRYCAMLAGSDLRREGSTYTFRHSDPQSPPVRASRKRTGSALLKATGIQFPKLDLQGSTFREAIEFIQAKSVGLDAKGEGANIILKPGPEMDRIRITLKLDNFPLSEVVRLVAEQAGYIVEDDDFALIVRPKAK